MSTDVLVLTQWSHISGTFTLIDRVYSQLLPAVEKESTLRDRIFEKGMRFKGRGPSDDEVDHPLSRAIASVCVTRDALWFMQIQAFKQERDSTKEKKAMLAGLGNSDRFLPLCPYLAQLCLFYLGVQTQQ